MKHWQCVRVLNDIVSGNNDDREGFQYLLAAIRDGKLDVVIVYRLDRLSRNVRDIYDFLDSIRDFGVGFGSVTEGFDTTTATGRAMLGVAAVFAQLITILLTFCVEGLRFDIAVVSPWCARLSLADLVE